MPFVTIRSTFDWRIWIAAVLLVGGGANALARAQSPEKCAQAKTKASAAAVAAQARCQASAASKGTPVDPKCLQKAESKLRASFAKAESKATCPGNADAAVLLRPVTVETIRAAAAADLRMPEKTTFFAPTPRTGMVFRSLD